MKISKKSTIYRFIDQKEQILLEIVSDALFRGFSVPGKSLSVPRACLRCSRLFSTLSVCVAGVRNNSGFQWFFNFAGFVRVAQYTIHTLIPDY